MTDALLHEISSSGEAAVAQFRSATTLDALRSLGSELLGKKGPLAGFKAKLGSLDPDARRDAGQAVNAAMTAAQAAFDQRQDALAAAALDQQLLAEKLDLTEVTARPTRGHAHLVTQVWERLEDVFVGLGFTIAEGPEVETDYYNFQALGMGDGHPARSAFDTMFLNYGAPGSTVLRTHTSNVQIRSMENFTPPVKVLSCGRVYRRDEITMRRSPMFHQAEGFLVDKGIHIGHLRATLEHFIKRLFGADSKMRMRPSFFPFTEPSAEVDMSCVFCKGAGCGTCSQTGWMEILGCGMIHPQVLRNVGIDPEEWSGFAFGLGLDRCAMIKFDIPNIRTLFENDLRVLQQF